MKVSITLVGLVATALSALTPTSIAASSSTCTGTSCAGTLSFTTDTTLDVNDLATCPNSEHPYISAFDFRSSNDGFSYETTYRTSTGTVGTAFDCTSTENHLASARSGVQCGVGSTGALKIKFTCNNLLATCKIAWSFGFVCPTPAGTGNSATSGALSTVAVTAGGQAAAIALPALGAAVAMHR